MFVGTVAFSLCVKDSLVKRKDWDGAPRASIRLWTVGNAKPPRQHVTTARQVGLINNMFKRYESEHGLPRFPGQRQVQRYLGRELEQGHT